MRCPDRTDRDEATRPATTSNVHQAVHDRDCPVSIAANVREPDRVCVFGMIGSRPCRFDAGDTGEIGQTLRRFEALDEVRETRRHTRTSVAMTVYADRHRPAPCRQRTPRRPAAARPGSVLPAPLSARRIHCCDRRRSGQRSASPRAVVMPSGIGRAGSSNASANAA